MSSAGGAAKTKNLDNEGPPKGSKGKASKDAPSDGPAVVHRMEGYFDKLKSKKALGSDFNKRYFAVVRSSDDRYFLNYYGKRTDLAGGTDASGSIELSDITFIGIPGQPADAGGRPDFQVGDPEKLRKEAEKRKAAGHGAGSSKDLKASAGAAESKDGGADGAAAVAAAAGSTMVHNAVMEKHADRGIQIGSRLQNIFIVADNKSMAKKWISGLCIMRDLPAPPGMGWPKKFGPPPARLYKANADGTVAETPKEKVRPFQGYFNSLVVEKGE
jgi:hypothetical protein